MKGAAWKPLTTYGDDDEMKKTVRKAWQTLTAGTKESLLLFLGLATFLFAAFLGLDIFLEREVYRPPLTDDNYAVVVDYRASDRNFIFECADGSRVAIPDTNPSTKGCEIGTRVLLDHTINYGLPPWLENTVQGTYAILLCVLAGALAFGMAKSTKKNG